MFDLMYIVWSYFQMKHTFLMTFSFLIFFPSSLLGVRSDRTASQFICIVWCYFSFCYCCCCCCCWLPQRINQILMGNKNLRPFHKLRHFLPDGLSDQSEEVWTMGKADECAIAGKSITKPLYCNNARIVSYTSLDIGNFWYFVWIVVDDFNLVFIPFSYIISAIIVEKIEFDRFRCFISNFGFDERNQNHWNSNCFFLSLWFELRKLKCCSEMMKK